MDDNDPRYCGLRILAWSTTLGASSFEAAHRFSSATSKSPFLIVKISIEWAAYCVPIHGKLRELEGARSG